MEEREKAIGIFDSGVGGLTVLKEIQKALPNESCIYLGDTARVPYGTKSAQIVTTYALGNARFLTSKGIKLVVIACNTASAFSLGRLVEALSIPVVGVVEPGAERGVKITKTKRIGVIGTEGTIASRAYTKAIMRLNPEMDVVAKACPLFVPLVEEGLIDHHITRQIVHYYLDEFERDGVDTVILGCTHYPMLKPVLGEILGGGITLVDSAKETASVVARLLDELSLHRPTGDGSCKYYLTDIPGRFVRIGQQILGKAIGNVEMVHLEL